MLDNFEFTQEQTAPRRLGPCKLQRVFKNIENQDNLVTRSCTTQHLSHTLLPLTALEFPSNLQVGSFLQ